MKALTLYEPWATLVARGEKRIETRSWKTNYRGPLAIHASKKRFGFSSPTAEWVRAWPREVYRRVGNRIGDPELCDNYPLGSVVAVATLLEVLPIVEPPFPLGERCVSVDEEGIVRRWKPDALNDAPVHIGEASWASDREDGYSTEDEALFGDFTPGRYAWLLGDVRRLMVPSPAKGALGLWELDEKPLELVL
jgi:activating signal cointegrator 1